MVIIASWIGLRHIVVQKLRKMGTLLVHFAVSVYSTIQYSLSWDPDPGCLLRPTYDDDSHHEVENLLAGIAYGSHAVVTLHFLVLPSRKEILHTRFSDNPVNFFNQSAASSKYLISHEGARVISPLPPEKFWDFRAKLPRIFFSKSIKNQFIVFRHYLAFKKWLHRFFRFKFAKTKIFLRSNWFIF